MDEEITYSRKQLELMKSRTTLADIALKLGAKTRAKDTIPALIDAILAAQKKRAAAAKKAAQANGAADTDAPTIEEQMRQAERPTGDHPQPAKPKRKRAQRAVKHNEDGVVLGDDGNPEPLPEGMENDPPEPPKFNSDEEALEEIARTSVNKERAIDELASARRDLNNEVKQAKAAHTGAIQAGVDYKDHASVRQKLEEVTQTWQHMNDCEEKRRLELIPLKEKVQAARKRYREAIDGANQLKLFA